MEAPKINEKVKNAVERINQILNEENIMLVPVTTIVNGKLAQRVEVIEKPVQLATVAEVEKAAEAETAGDTEEKTEEAVEDKTDIK
jgi:hypothetical protein